jgi:hypothetical protein
MFAAGLGELPEAAGGCVPVHPHATGVEQDWPCGPAADGAVDRAADCRRQQGDEDDLGPFAAHREHAVAMLLAEVGDVGPGDRPKGVGGQEPRREAGKEPKCVRPEHHFGHKHTCECAG